MASLHGLLVAFAAIALVRFCTADPQGAANSSASTAIVIGSVECDGCLEQNLDRRLALSGSSVAIQCKTGKEETTIHGVGSVDENGSFSVKLSSSALNERGELAFPCFARLVSGNQKLCSFANTPSSKLVFKSPHTLTTSEVLSFSSSSCKAKPLAYGKRHSHQLSPKPKLVPKTKIFKPKPSPTSELLPPALAKQDGKTQSYTSRSNSPSVAPTTIGQAKTFFFAPPLKDMLPTGGPKVPGYPFPFIPIINTKYEP